MDGSRTHCAREMYLACRCAHCPWCTVDWYLRKKEGEGRGKRKERRKKREGENDKRMGTYTHCARRAKRWGKKFVLAEEAAYPVVAAGDAISIMREMVGLQSRAASFTDAAPPVPRALVHIQRTRVHRDYSGLCNNPHSPSQAARRESNTVGVNVFYMLTRTSCIPNTCYETKKQPSVGNNDIAKGES